MARGRLISKSLGSSRKFHALILSGGKLGEFAQVLFMLIIANTDEFGRMPGDAFTVKALVLPTSTRSERDFDRSLGLLADVGLVERYQVNDAIYLQVQQFDEHQVNLHKRTSSKFPESPGISGKVRLNLTESNLIQSKGKESNSSASGATCVTDPFEQFWDTYPKKKAKKDARKAWEKQRPDGELFLTILAAIASQRQSAEWLRDRGRYIPHPATWLNRGQWSDGADPPIDSLSETTRYNLAASEEAERLILENDQGKPRVTHGPRR